jgi:hypothetical protein
MRNRLAAFFFTFMSQTDRRVGQHDEDSFRCLMKSKYLRVYFFNKKGYPFG